MQIIVSSVFFYLHFPAPSGHWEGGQCQKEGKNRNSRPEVIGGQKDMRMHIMQVMRTVMHLQPHPHSAAGVGGRGSRHVDSWVKRWMLLWGEVAPNKCVLLTTCPLHVLACFKLYAKHPPPSTTTSSHSFLKAVFLQCVLLHVSLRVRLFAPGRHTRLLC